MDYTLLNDQKTKISRISLGTWAFSGAAVWGECDEIAAIHTIHSALDRGINLFDTAEAYGDGESEKLLGKALKERRNSAIIATKVYSNHLDYQGIIESCEASLRRLDTDYLDILQIHWPNKDISIEESFRAFDKLKVDGKVRNISVCNHGIKSMEAIEGHDVVLNQMPYSLIWRLGEYHLSKQMDDKGVLLWAYSPLAQGLLTGKYKTIEDVPMNRRTTRMYNSKWGVSSHTDNGFEVEIFGFLKKLRALCEETGYSMTALAFGFLKCKENLGSILVGARDMIQLDQNLEAYYEIITEDILEEIEGLSLELKLKMGTNADLWQNCIDGKGRIV